ncbi:hypothetical protein [Aeromonas molluscorum]|uniref:Uncharacterized protein n=1 Tax=Aeromonas molluscorum 848 TaxID=1268236 RepID=R1H0V3_9GAMM|nr:hypothetical protein [Aeromonas molluscorum]EOD54276.1 hypothetical protein G113_15216 [Aeromonas molluscorum 848]
MNAPHKAAATKDAPADFVMETQQDANSASHPTLDKVTQNTHEVVDKLAEAAGSTATTLSDKGSDLKKANAPYLNKMIEQIKRNPVGSVSLAIAIGFIISWLIILIY